MGEIDPGVMAALTSHLTLAADTAVRLEEASAHDLSITGRREALAQRLMRQLEAAGELAGKLIIQDRGLRKLTAEEVLAPVQALDAPGDVPLVRPDVLQFPARGANFKTIGAFNGGGDAA